MRTERRPLPPCLRRGLRRPYGIAFQPAGANPKWVYVAEVNRVVRYPYKKATRWRREVPEVIVPELSPVGAGHYTRDIAFSADGKKMYVSVGSQSNVADTATIMPKKTAAEVRDWDAQHGLGAACGRGGSPRRRASSMVGKRHEGPHFRHRHPQLRVGMTVQPANGALWCAANERDMLGDARPRPPTTPRA